MQNSPFPITGHITFPTIYLIFRVLCYKDEPACLLIFRNVTFPSFSVYQFCSISLALLLSSLSFFRIFQRVKQLVCVSYKTSYFTPTGVAKAYEIFWMTRNFPEYISLIQSSCICISHSQQACCKLSTSVGMQPILLHVLL